MRKYGRSAKRRARLFPALGAMAYIQRQGFGQRRLERHCAALTPRVHGGRKRKRKEVLKRGREICVVLL